MATQGILLPVSLLISNLLEIANLLKQFAGKNILGDSLGGKKVELELNTILRSLGAIETKAKNAFKTNAEFGSVEKDINKIELSLDHVKNVITNIPFSDLKIPPEAALLIEELNKKINTLNNGLMTFKASLKDKLLGNVDFTSNLSLAFGKNAAGILTKNYDEMYAAVKNGMEKVNAELIVLKSNFERNSLMVTLNTTGKANFSAWGALDFISKAFEKLPKDKSKWSEQQNMLKKYMNFDEASGQFTTFNSRLGGQGAEGFYRELALMFDLQPQLLEDIRKRVTASVVKGKKTASDVLRLAAQDLNFGASIFGGKGMTYKALTESKENYESNIRQRDASKITMDATDLRAKASSAAYNELMQKLKEVEALQRAVAQALREPESALLSLEAQIRANIMSTPWLGLAFLLAAKEISLLLSSVNAGKAQLENLNNALNKMNGVLNFINRYVGAYAIVRKVTLAIRSAFNNIKELDKAITGIAVVTNMSQLDLWGKIGQYTLMAQQYGVATKDVYTVSQIFYQQGLLTAQVMSMTTESLKMAKIAGIDYSTAANAMTVAIRAFKLEMSEAQLVTDTYSALAAKFAVSSSEIANAMEKTASSAASVGMSLQSTSAFISVMEQTTREGAQNIGSALKSIISRYGEMKASPAKLLEVDGEEVAFNKVDTALKSIGISIKDSAGLFRDFDDVIMELSLKWDSLDNNTQRYIATIMAGNRQQSRFIALVSNYDELNRAMNVASNSENASIVQTAKTMDSLESKANLLKNAFSLIYLDIHAEEGLKSMYDWLTRILKTIGKLGMFNGAILTLMNIVGFGTGAKKLIGMGKDALTAKARTLLLKVDVDTKEAENKITEFLNKIQETAIKKVTLDVDSSLLDIAYTKMLTMNQANMTNASINAVNAILATNPTNSAGKLYTTTELTGLMSDALKAGLLGTKEGRADFMANQIGIKLDNPLYESIDNLLIEFNKAATSVLLFSGAIEKASTAAEANANAETDAANKKNALSPTTLPTSPVVPGTIPLIVGTVPQVMGAVPTVINAPSLAIMNTGLDTIYNRFGATYGYENKELFKLTLSSYGSMYDITNEDERKALATEIVGNSDSEDFSALDLFLAKIAEVPNALDSLDSAFEKAALNIALANELEKLAALDNARIKLQEAQAAFDKINGDKSSTDSARLKAAADLEAADAAVLNAQNLLETASAAKVKALADYDAANAAKNAEVADLSKGLSALQAGIADLEKIPPAKEAAEVDREKASAGRASGGGWTGKETAMKWTGLLSGVARMAGTAVTALGAAHEDKSTDTGIFGLRVEHSKLLTGLGNGISMAGTGASMGMAFGPWGAAIGAIGGFLLGGLGAILDGATMTLLELLALEKEEAKKASDRALKEQAKTTDLSSLIENLLLLRKNMYNSVDDMKAYTEAMNNLGAQYPELISAYDLAGNAIINLLDAELHLLEVRLLSAIASRDAAVAEAKTRVTLGKIFSEFMELSKTELAHTAETEVEASEAVTEIKVGGNELGTEYTVQGGNAAPFILEIIDAVTDESSFGMYSQLLPGSKLKLLADKYKANGQFTYTELDEFINEVVSGGHLAQNSSGGLTFNYDFGTGFGYTFDSSTPVTWDQLNNFLSRVRLAPTKGVRFDAGKVEGKWDAFLKENATELGISTPEDGKWFRAWLGIGENEAITLEHTRLAEQKLGEKLASWENSAKVLNSQIARTTALVKLDTAVMDPTLGLSTTTASKLLTSNIFTSLITNGLEKSLPSLFKDMAEWELSDSSGLLLEAEKITSDILNDVLTWSDSKLEDFIETTSHLDEYTSIDSILNKFGIDKNSKLAETLMMQFAQDNQENKNRILKTIYEYDKKGYRTGFFNNELLGLNKFTKTVYRGGIFSLENEAFDISELFESDQIISKYADFFVSQLVDINKLAENGYNEMALAQLHVLKQFATDLSGYSDEVQNDLFGIITAVDFSSYESITLAKEDIEAYGKKHHINVDPFLSDLDWAIENLVFNVTTLASELSNKVLSTVKEIDSLISKAKSGFGLDEALTALNKINARSKDRQYGFDELFTYDAALGKFVYTQLGLALSLDLEEGRLEEQAQMLEVTAAKEKDMALLGEVWLGKYKYEHARGASRSNPTFTKTEDLMAMVSRQTGYNTDYSEEYEVLAADFLSNDEYKEKTWENWLLYLLKRAKEDGELAELARQIFENYQDNKVHLLFGLIDWGALATETDFGGTNRTLLRRLGKELGIFDEELGQWAAGYTEDRWDQILELYLDKTYGTDTEIAALAPDESAQRRAAKEAARAANVGKIRETLSNLISTAITEMLAGEGQVLSDTSIALIGKTNNLDYPAEGVLKAGDNFIDSAIKLYELHADNLLSLSAKNEAYSAIMSKSFEKSNELITALSSGASLDIGSLSTLFTTFGLELADYFDAATKEWKPGADAMFSTDAFGKTRIKNWNAFMALVKAKNPDMDMDAYASTFEYRNAYATYVDGLISLDTEATNLIKGLYDAAFSSITLFKQLNVSEIMDRNRGIVDALASNGAGIVDDKGLLKITDTILYAHNAIGVFSSLSTLSDADLYAQTGWTLVDLAKNWKAAQTIITDSYNAWSGIAGNLTSLTDDNVATLMEKGGLGIKEFGKIFEKVGDTYVLKLSEYRKQLIESVGGRGKSYYQLSPYQQALVDKAMESAEDAIAENLGGLNWEKVINRTASNSEMTAFLENLMGSLKSLGLNDALIKKIYQTDPISGKTVINLTTLRELVARSNKDVGKAFSKSLETTIATVRDAALTEINNSIDYSINGATNLSDVNAFVQRYNELTGLNKKIDDLFGYDTMLGTFTLNNKALEEYQQALKEYLISLGMNEEMVDAYIKHLTEEMLQNNLDISSFLDGGYLTPGSKDTLKLISQILLLSGLTGKAAEMFADNMLNAMLKGGDRAVWALKRLKGADNVTAEEIAKAYRGKADKLNESLEHISAQAGEIVDSYTASIFESAGAQVKDLGNGQFVIESIPNGNWGEKIAGAYLKLYNTLKKTAGSTVSELNSAYAKILTTALRSLINPIEALSDAASMTYEALGEILAKEGKLLEDVIGDPERYGIEFLGAGKVQIADFTKFAKQMGWDTNSPEYTKAFKAHNDALIEMDKETSEAIMEEAQSLKDAKIGDKINLTYIWDTLSDAMGYQFDTIIYLLRGYGAEFKDGILTIGANADILGIINTITQATALYGNLLPDELAELADVVAEYIEGIINIINNGIKGSLSNTEALLLLSWADIQGLGKLDFTLTAEGLKLSQQSAMKLYSKLKDIDVIRASLVFDELNDSLKETNEHYKSVSSILARIRELNEKIAEAESRGDTTRADLYREELDLAKEILAVRSTSEDDSFSFMSGDIPAAQKNPLNYAKNWTLAFLVIRDGFKVKKGGKKGFIDYEDWYNIVTEMNRLAAIGGPILLGALKLDGSLEAASAAILAGASSLTAIDTGEVKVNLSAAGINIKSGADALNSGVTDGLQALAQSQIDMLDGLIAMLELIVSMEQLGDIDVDNNGIQWEEMFTFDEASGAINGFNKNFENWLEYCKKLIDEGNEDLANAFKGIKIGTISLDEVLKWSPEDFQNADEAVKKMLPVLMTVLKQAAESGDWDLDNIGLSMIDILKASGFDGTIPLDIGNMTLFISGKSMVTVNWEDANVEEVLKTVNTDKEKAKTEIRGWIDKYLRGEALDSTSLTYVLAVTGKVRIENGEAVSVTVGGKTYTGDKIPAAIRAAALEDAGIAVSKDSINNAKIIDTGDGKKDAIVYETTFIGNQLITVLSGPTGIQYQASDGSWYDSPDELMEYEWSKEVDMSHRMHYNLPFASFEQWRWAKYHIAVEMETEIVGTDGKPIQFNNIDSKTKKEWENIVSRGRDAFNNFIEDKSIQPTDNGDGTFTIDLNGYKFTFTGGDDWLSAFYDYMSNAFGIDASMATTISSAITTAFNSPEVLTAISNAISAGLGLAFGEEGIPIDKLTLNPNEITVETDPLALTKAIEEATGIVKTLKILVQDTLVIGATAEIGNGVEGDASTLSTNTINVNADTTEAERKITTFKEEKLNPLTIDIGAKDKDAITKATEIANKINAMSAAIRITASNSASGVINAIHTALDNLVNSGPYRVTVEALVYMGGGGNAVNFTKATGNLGLARAQGTLMGELGPELVVSNGRYFVAGLNGPEMVDLADDAIVFNHLQTKSLLEKGMSSGRGKAVTNERNAVSFAKGNINGGPAMASAAAALAALKELRALWEALRGLSAKDLAGKGGSGGGGGGNKAFIKDLEKWYNWLQRIALLEQDITYEEAKRSKIQSDRYADGKKYYKSQVESLKKLQEEAEIHADLAASQLTYFNLRRNELNSDKNPFNSLYWFNTDGQLIYKDGKLEELSNMVGSDKYNNPNMTAEELYKYITGTLGIDKKYLQYDSSGNKIEGTDYTSMVLAFWDKIDSDKEEMQSLHDSIAEHEKAVLEMEQKRNEILNEMRDNLISLEEAVLDAMTLVALREIDALLKLRDAIEAANSAMILGLSDALARELQIYLNNLSAVELDKMRRLLTILLRSGGSAAEISSLLSLIDESALLLYFDKQLEQIDLLLAASDAQLEKLDKLIDLMTETLAYEKEHGLLWSKVHEIMEKSPEDIATYILKNNAEFWGLSPVANEKKYRETLFSAEQWTEYAKNIESITEKYTGSSAAKAKAAANNPSEGSGSGSGSGSGGSGSGGSGSKSGGKSGGTGGKTNKEGNKKSGMSGEQLEQKYGNNYGKNEYSGSTVINIAAETRSNSTNNRNNIYTKENTKSNGDITYRLKKIYKSTYATGGIVEADGQAYLHADEAVLTPEQTRILRNDILGSNNNSLLNLLQDFRAAMAGTSNDYSSINNNNGITIEHAEVNMHVDKLANGYDAAKAGQDVMTEMLRIARKTTTNKVGR